MVPEDLERLIHEALEQLGWEADAQQISNRVNRLNLGLPSEDEFTILCGWLGKCRLIHKLDQQQYPKLSKEAYQVPDLLAVFEKDKKLIRVLIEVKCSTKKNMSFKPDYIQKLKAYGDIIGAPVLIAWKFHSIWSLFHIDAMKKANVNYNIAFTESLKDSLMGVLVGDFTYSLCLNSGLHIKMNKEELISTSVLDDEHENQQWKMRVSDVYYTNGNGDVLKDLSAIAQKVFFAWDLEYNEEHHDEYILTSYMCNDRQSIFAHMALVRILNFFNYSMDERMHWRSLLGDNSYLNSVDNFRSGIEENLHKGVVHFIGDILPQNNYGIFD